MKIKIFSILLFLVFQSLCVFSAVVDINVSTLDVLHDGETTISEVTSNTGGVLDFNSEITTNGWMFIDKDKILWFSDFNVSGYSGNITAVQLKIKYSVEAGYAGSNYVQYDNGSGLFDTGSQPLNGENNIEDVFDLYSLGVDTWAEIGSLDIKYTNNDGGGADGVSFDYIQISVTYDPFTIPAGIINMGATLTITSGTVLEIFSNFSNQYSGTYPGQIDLDGTIVIDGNWSNINENTDETVFINIESGSVPNGITRFESASAQTIGGSRATVFENLYIDNSNISGIDLSTPISVKGKMKFYDGLVNSDATNLVIFDGQYASSEDSDGGGTAFDAASDISHINGPAMKTGTDNFVFPVGSGTKFRPIGISDLSGSESFTAEYFQENPDNGGYDPLVIESVANFDHVSICEYWTLARASTENAKVILSWDDITSCGVTGYTDLLVAHWDATIDNRWESKGGTGHTGDNTLGTVTTPLAVSDFSPFTLASSKSDGSLPVEFLDFYTNCENGITHINWSTSSENNNDFFTVEYSTMQNGSFWKEIAIVEGSGNNNSFIEYTVVDKISHTSDQAGDQAYYRVKQTDFNGNHTYSNIITSQCSQNKNILEPLIITEMQINSEFIYVRFSSPVNETIATSLFDVRGRLITNETILTTPGINEIKLKISGLSKGVYMLSLKSPGKIVVNKIIL